MKKLRKIEGIKNIMEYTVNPTNYDHFLTSKFTFCEYFNEYSLTKNDVSERIKIFLQNSPLSKFSEILILIVLSLLDINQ